MLQEKEGRYTGVVSESRDASIKSLLEKLGLPCEAVAVALQAESREEAKVRGGGSSGPELRSVL